VRSIADQHVEQPGGQWSILHRRKPDHAVLQRLPGTFRQDREEPSSRPVLLRRAAARGALAGLAGVAAMTAAEKAEQAFTRRPDSYVPARALLSLLGRAPGDSERSWGWNHAMHWGTGAVLGALRGVWSATGIRGTQANVTHTVVRLAFDQTVENATGVGAPPATWPRSERAVDVVHKAIYAAVTGSVADRLVAPTLESRRGTVSH
jgi:hypothetical protein